MKKSILNQTLVAAVFALVLTACSKKQDVTKAPGDAEGLLTTYTIDFEGVGRGYMADTTPQANNAYSSWGGTQILPYVHSPSNLRIAIKGAGSGPVNYWDGGFILSDWNYKSNIPGKSGDWWYSWLNQASVYSGTHGAKNGGYGGSSNFAVMFGYVDAYNSSFGVTRPTINFTSGSGIVEGMYICLNSYAYGVIEYGNTFGSGVATPLKDIANGQGYLKLLAYGYNGSTPTNGGNPVEIFLAAYNNHLPVVAPVTTWTYFDLTDLDTVTRVEFNIAGNDSGMFGLNTPAYVCMDNVKVTL